MISPLRYPLLKTVASVAVFCVSMLPAKAEQCSIDWTFLSEGASISKDPYGAKGAPVLIQSPEVITVLRIEGTPANPFPTGNALSIAAKDDNRFFRIRIRPFERKIEESGFVECNFRLTAGVLRLSFGAITKEWNPEDDWAYIDNKRLFNFRFSTGEAIQAGSVTGLGTQDHPVLSSETNYKFRVSWQTKSDELVFTAQLNGLPIMDKEDKPFYITISTSAIPQEASLGMVLQSGSADEPLATAVIGSIEAKTGEN